jgi:hypothetical protein
MNQPEEAELVPLTTSAAHDDHVDSEEQTPAILFPRHHRGPTTASDRPRGYWWTVLLLMVMTGGGGLLLILSSDPRSVPIAEAGRPLASNNETTLHYPMAATASTQTQIDHYRRDGTALILNVHITHHAGTTFCAAVRRAPHTLGAPTFACMGVKPVDNVTVTNYPSHRPWNYNETGPNVALVRPFFHMISWEFGWHHRPQPVLGQSTNWEHPQLVSVYISKHPLERMLSSGSHYFGTLYPGTRNGTANEMEWWRFAQDDWNNNYALRILSDSPACCDGANTTVADVASAQALLRRFTFVLDCTVWTRICKRWRRFWALSSKSRRVGSNIMCTTKPWPNGFPTRRFTNT